MNKTFYQSLVDMLKENGLFDNMAHDAAAKVMAHPNMSNMEGRWSNEVSSYPSNLMGTLWLLAKPIVYEHISEVAPQAWFRPVFAPGVDSATDAEAFVNNFWDTVRAADQIPEGSKQQEYSLKHLDTEASTTILKAPGPVDFPDGTVLTGEAALLGTTDNVNVPKIEFDAELVKQDDGGYKAQIKAPDLTKETQRALALGFYHKVMAAGLVYFNTKVVADPSDELLLTFTATPREAAVLKGYALGVEQLHAKLVDNPSVGEDGILKSNG